VEREPVLHPRLRVLNRGAIVLGPGKADLLEGIKETGSISEAAAELGMSYMRAWTLIRTMNTAFREPLVLTVRGGEARGGATLSEIGERILSTYREMENLSLSATAEKWKALRKLLRQPAGGGDLFDRR
jgi:molybdate transport system regulatory protein